MLIYNAGYMEGRDLPPDKELLEHMPTELFDTAQHIASRGPFLVAKEVLPAMREAGAGTFLISNNSASLRGRKRYTGQSLYYPRVMMRALAQVLTEEYSEYGVHVANVVIDGLIDSPGTRALPIAQKRPEATMNPEKIADAFFYLHTQDRSAWTHELQLTPVRDEAQLLIEHPAESTIRGSETPSAAPPKRREGPPPCALRSDYCTAQRPHATVAVLGNVFRHTDSPASSRGMRHRTSRRRFDVRGLVLQRGKGGAVRLAVAGKSNEYRRRLAVGSAPHRARTSQS